MYFMAFVVFHLFSNITSHAMERGVFLDTDVLLFFGHGCPSVILLSMTFLHSLNPTYFKYLQLKQFLLVDK